MTLPLLRRSAIVVAGFVFTIAPWGLCSADEKSESVKAEESKYDNVSYFLGISFGQQLSQNGFLADDFKTEDLWAGIQDGLEKSEPALTDDQLAATQKKIQGMLETRLKQKGLNFLAENKKAEGVKELAGGLQYKVIKEGDGDSPSATDTVKVHYTGKLIDGTVFDSSVQRGEPATFRVNQVIKGWQMALQKMKAGDKWMLYIPSELGYGARGSAPAIGPFEVLVFEVELIEIQ